MEFPSLMFWNFKFHLFFFSAPSLWQLRQTAIIGALLTYIIKWLIILFYQFKKKKSEGFSCIRILCYHISWYQRNTSSDKNWDCRHHPSYLPIFSRRILMVVGGFCLPIVQIYTRATSRISDLISNNLQFMCLNIFLAKSCSPCLQITKPSHWPTRRWYCEE